MSDWNTSVIEEFRANQGRVGGPFAGGKLLLLTTTGAKSGKPHTTPLVYLPDGDRMIIIASAAGAPKNPAWYHNLLAHPQASVEVGTETFKVTATVATDEERNRYWERVVRENPGFADYQKKTTRQIPIVILQR